VATKVLGYVSEGVREIGPPDRTPQVQLSQDGRRPVLTVVENGDARHISISRRVAEVLIACGFSYGS